MKTTVTVSREMDAMIFFPAQHYTQKREDNLTWFIIVCLIRIFCLSDNVFQINS